MTLLAIMLAVAGACCYAVAAWLQHSAVHLETAGGGFRFRSFARLVRAPRWIGGLLLTGIAATLHAIALGLAPITVVQPIGVLAIALTALLPARSGGVRLALPTVLAVAASMVGVGLFVTLAAGTTTNMFIPRTAELSAAVLVLSLVIVLGVIGRLGTGRVRCVAFAASAGVAYGLVSVLVHTTATRMKTGGIQSINVVVVAGIVAALLLGGWLVQHAYANGPPHVVVACLTVIDPILAVGVGIGLLKEGARITMLSATSQIGCAILAIIGVVVLARHYPAPGNQNPRHQERSVNRSLPSGLHPLRIVVGADTFPPDINGAARFAERLSHGLARRGHDVHVICPSSDTREHTETTDGITVHRVPSRRTPFHSSFRICLPWQAFRASNALLDELSPDLVHIQAHFLVGRALARTAASRNIPVIATNHFMPENLFGHGRIPGWLQSLASRFAWRDLYRVYRDADIVTAPTPRAVELLEENGLPQRAIAISCGIDIDHFRSRDGQHGTKQDGRTVLFVGRLDEEKRVDELLRATAMLPAENTVNLEIVGDGSCRAAWEALAEQLGIASQVRFRGFVDDAELVDAYARCDVFCMPGIAELQSLVTMEAMAAGKPVIAADAMALPHLVHPDRNGWLYPPGDVTALADRLTRIFSEPNALARMGAASKDIIAGHSLDRSLNSFESLYRRALAQHESADQPDAAVAIR